jgi:hypothetical protein
LAGAPSRKHLDLGGDITPGEAISDQDLDLGLPPMRGSRNQLVGVVQREMGTHGHVEPTSVDLGEAG